MNGSCTQRPSSPRTFFLLLILIALVVALLVAVAPALAYDNWEHGGARESTCDSSGCHRDQTPSNTACTQSGCHSGYTTSSAKKCWDCHAPGTAPSVSCTGSCHLYQANGDHPTYPTVFTHEATPHLGASGYGKTCVDCHRDGNSHHDATAGHQPTCAECHNGSIAPAKQGHAGQACASCHTGMARPPVPATCHNCHDAQTFGAVTCTTCHSTTGWIGKETIHATDPAATVSCTTCHKTHYEDLGACDTCHGSDAETHHGTATLADTQLKLAARPARVKAHKKATLRGSLQAGGKALASQKVLIQARKVKGDSFKKVAIVKTGADGRFSRVVKPRVSTVYRAVWRPAGAYVVQQRPAIVTVKLRVRK